MRPRANFILIGLVVLVPAFPACSRFSGGAWEPVGQVPLATTPNPLPVPFYPRELVMDEASDEIENYFRILREQRIRLVGDILTEGFIDTEPKIGSTLLEPWRRDSSSGFEVAHATLQTVRRWARVRVIPTSSNYLIDVKVYKELEDLEQPMRSTVSGRSLRHNSSLNHGSDEAGWTPVNRGWIPMGRDFALEQTILANLQSRFEAAAANGAQCVR